MRAAPWSFTTDCQDLPVVSRNFFFYLDFGLQKHFRVTEKLSLGVRMEAMSLFNRVNLNPPTANTGSAANGQITSISGDPRMIQMSLRVDV